MVGDVQRRDDVIETRHPFGEGGGGKGGEGGISEFRAGINMREKWMDLVWSVGIECVTITFAILNEIIVTYLFYRSRSNIFKLLLDSVKILG